MLKTDFQLIKPWNVKRKRVGGKRVRFDINYGKTSDERRILELPVDILVPAALENMINDKNMAKIKAKIIVEMANGPLTQEAYEYLAKKGTSHRS